MPYATLADLIDRFDQDELDQVADTGSGVADPIRVAQALSDADAEIDAALIGRYALPMVPVPTILVRIGADLARESLYIDKPTETVTDRAERARALLLQIAKGTMRLVAAAAPATTSTEGLVEIVSGRTKSPFTGGKL